jgi:GNAT superfamily N-acetyltransferase
LPPRSHPEARGRLRPATRADVSGMQRVRGAVRENRLVSCVISDADVADAIERTGRGWVVEVDSRVIAFAVGNAETGNIWALFVDPDCEGRGYGRQLHDAMIAWLWSRGLRRLWLSTEPGTRAERFYLAAGWQRSETLPSGEILFELHSG